LIEITKQQAKFVVESNKTQTMMAGEIKSSGDEARLFSKTNIFLTLIVILFAVLSVAVNWYSISSSNDNMKNLLHSLNTSITVENRNLELLVIKQNEMIEELKNLKLRMSENTERFRNDSISAQQKK